MAKQIDPVPVVPGGRVPPRREDDREAGRPENAGRAVSSGREDGGPRPALTPRPSQRAEDPPMRQLRSLALLATLLCLSMPPAGPAPAQAQDRARAKEVIVAFA